MLRTFLRRRRVLHHIHLAESLECRRLLAIVNGVAYDDYNDNHAFDSGEALLGGATLFVDLNDNAVNDEGEPSAISNLFGEYQISNVPTGTYTVRGECFKHYLTAPATVVLGSPGTTV